MAAVEACASLASYGIDLVDEHHSGSGFLRLGEQVADAAGAHAYIQLHEVGTGDGEELYPRLAGHRLGQQRLTSTRRAH